MASDHPPYRGIQEPTTAEKVEGFVWEAKNSIKQALMKLTKETGLYIEEIEIRYIVKTTALGQHIEDAQLITKIKLMEEL